MAVKTFNVEQYLLSDYPRTLFPLSTTSLLVEKCSGSIKDFLYDTILATETPGFPIQHRCYSAKRGHNLRRTVKLDPVAEFFVYDVVFRNRKTFRQDHNPSRQSFGYRFTGGEPEPISGAYAKFKAAIAKARGKKGLTLKTDVATYFNSIYHHDLMKTVRDIDWPQRDADALGRFLREINAGRSIDCLPHGLHPCKVLGSEFLRFIDNSVKLKSRLGLRFLDDIHLFDSDRKKLLSDLVTLQELLGEKGLSINEGKTALGRVIDVDLPKEVDSIKQGLLQMRRKTLTISGEDSDDDEEDPPHLNGRQVEYLLGVLQSPDIEESDAELVLVLLRDHAEEVFGRIGDFLERYPGLAKSVYHYARLVQDRSGLASIILEFLNDSPNATEYQLFWLAKTVEDFLFDSDVAGKIVAALLDHPRASIISRAKVLEIPSKRHGLPELREEVLRSGRSDWEAWAAAGGTKNDLAANRNHLMTYFAKGSPLNSFLASCFRSMG